MLEFLKELFGELAETIAESEVADAIMINFAKVMIVIGLAIIFIFVLAAVLNSLAGTTLGSALALGVVFWFLFKN